MKFPDAKAVATRAIILRFVAVTAISAPPRGFMDQWSKSEKDDFTKAAEEQQDRVLKALGELKFELTPWEQEFFASSAATMTERQQVNALWRSESFQVLLWALNVIDKLPAYDQHAEEDILNSYPKPDIKTAIQDATLRSSSEIQRQRDIAELWHWRSRTRELMERRETISSDPELQKAGFNSYDDIIRIAATRAAHDGVTLLTSDDFTLKGKAYRDLTDKEWSYVRSITIERHFSLNWLCGLAPANQWDETPTDT